MWTIYDIHADRYWSERQRCWCSLREATFYSFEERDRLPLRKLSNQWRFIAPGLRNQPSAVFASSAR